jgi:hypothetical protein
VAAGASLWTDAEARSEIRIGATTIDVASATELDRYGRWDTARLRRGLVPECSAGWVPYSDGAWGWIEPWGLDLDRSRAHGCPVEGDTDLFNYGAVTTLRHKGSAMLAQPGALPRSSRTAAILRY